MNVTFSAQIWQYEGPGAWYFVTLPADLAREIRALQPRGLKGFGSVSVSVTCAEVTWTTSAFPDSKSGSYLVPLKAAVRKALMADVGQVLKFTLELD